MNKNTSYRIVLSGFLVCLGLLLPFATAHAFGMRGNIFLPMHMPVFLIGLLCGPMYGALGGILIPVLSCLFTGMPPLFPMLPIMTGELFTYGLISGLLYRKVRMPLYPSMLISMLCGRLVYSLIFQTLLSANNGNLRALSVTGALIEGIPGIVTQLILIPAIVLAIKKHLNFKYGAEPKMLINEKAKRMIKEGQASCVIIKNNKIIRTEIGQSIAPLISIYESEPEILKDAFVVDKVIGKAAAMMIVLGGANRAYGEIMSAAACNYLAERGCRAEYGERIEIVVNRSGDGMCPLENSVLDIDDPETGYHQLKKTISRLRNAG